MVSRLWRKWLLLTLGLMILLLTGCWDRSEIEERGFVLAVGLDEAPAGNLRVTFQVALPNLTNEGKGGGGGGMGKVRSYWNLVATAPTVQDAVEIAGTRIYRRLFFDHLQVIVMGEKMARLDFHRPLEFFTRSPEVRSRMPVYIARGEALEALNVQPLLEPVNAFYLARLSRSEKNLLYPRPLGLTEVHRHLHENSPMVLNKVSPGENDVSLSGGALIAGRRLAGWLDSGEVEALRFARGQVQGGELRVSSPGPGGKNVVGVITEAGSRLFPRVENGRLVMVLRLRVEVSIRESEEGINVLDVGTSEDLEKRMEDELTRNVEDGIRRIQQVYGADIFGFGREVEKRFPGWWRENKEQWPEIFPAVEARVNPMVFIRRPGLSK